MVTGALCGLVSTNALELGSILVRLMLPCWPDIRERGLPSGADGRAGRSGRACTNYLILDSQPFDQYIGTNRDSCSKTAVRAVVDKNNLLIELSHIRAAAARFP